MSQILIHTKAINLLLLLLFVISCNNKTSSDIKVNKQNSITSKRGSDTLLGRKVAEQTNMPTACDTTEYDRVLSNYALNFKATHIGLLKSIQSDKGLDDFLTRTDNVCLQKQHKWHYFVCLILLKQYYYHASVCHQGYNLFDECEGNSDCIVRTFEKLSGLNPDNIEFLNSGNIVGYIESIPLLKNDNEMKKILNQIKVVELNIKNGVYWNK